MICDFMLELLLSCSGIVFASDAFGSADASLSAWNDQALFRERNKPEATTPRRPKASVREAVVHRTPSKRQRRLSAPESSHEAKGGS
jgi:hypothetical protein